MNNYNEKRADEIRKHVCSLSPKEIKKQYYLLVREEKERKRRSSELKQLTEQRLINADTIYSVLFPTLNKKYLSIDKKENSEE